MRAELFYKPHLIFKRLAEMSGKRARLAKLKNTCAGELVSAHIDSLELLELLRDCEIKCIYDVGANVGTWTLLAKAVMPSARVEAFEPYVPHLNKLRLAVAQLSDVRAHEIALGAENGSATLRVTRFTDASSILLPVDRNSSATNEIEQVQVPIWRLDDYRDSNDLPFPDLIKLDVQGFELKVLEGATESLRRTRAVITEVSFREFYRGQCSFHEVVEFLAKQNLFLSAFGTNTRLGDKIEQTDVLFTSRDNT